MARRKKPQHEWIVAFLKEYSDSRLLEGKYFQPYHLRVYDAWGTCLDMWKSGKYWIKSSDYSRGNGIVVERGGEAGQWPLDKKRLTKFLDGVFFAPDIAEAKDD